MSLFPFHFYGVLTFLGDSRLRPTPPHPTPPPVRLRGKGASRTKEDVSLLDPRVSSPGRNFRNGSKVCEGAVKVLSVLSSSDPVNPRRKGSTLVALLTLRFGHTRGGGLPGEGGKERKREGVVGEGQREEKRPR